MASMGKQIKLPNIDFAEVGNTLVKAGKTVDTFVSNHVPEVLTTILAGVTIDNIRVRMGRKRDKKTLTKTPSNNSKLSENMMLKSMC